MIDSIERYLSALKDYLSMSNICRFRAGDADGFPGAGGPNRLARANRAQDLAMNLKLEEPQTWRGVIHNIYYTDMVFDVSYGGVDFDC